MNRSARLGAVALGVLAVAVATSVTAGLAGLAGTSAGAYQLDDVNAEAGFNFGSPPRNTNLTYQVERGTFLFTPAGGTLTTAHATVLGVNLFGPTGGGTACFVIPDGSLVGSEAQQRLDLHVTLTAAMEVAQSPLPLEGDLNGAAVPLGAPFGPCSPGFGTLPLPMLADVHWTAAASPTLRSINGTYGCGAFSEQYHLSNRFLAAQASTSAGGGASTTFAQVQAEHLASQVQGPGSIGNDCQGPIF